MKVGCSAHLNIIIQINIIYYLNLCNCHEGQMLETLSPNSLGILEVTQRFVNTFTLNNLMTSLFMLSLVWTYVFDEDCTIEQATTIYAPQMFVK